MCLENWSGSFEISINAPNVNYFGYFVVGVTCQTFVNLESLDSDAIDFPHKVGYLSHYINAATDLMRVISNIRTFRITGFTLMDIQKFSISIPVFHYVTHLTIFSCVFNLGALLHLFEQCVSLETLVFEEEITCYLDGWNPLEECRVICLSSRLKTIEICSFKGNEDQMELVKFFMKNAKCLERTKININNQRCEEKYEMSKRLLMFPRASKECTVVLY